MASASVGREKPIDLLNCSAKYKSIHTEESQRVRERKGATTCPAIYPNVLLHRCGSMVAAVEPGGCTHQQSAKWFVGKFPKIFINI